MKRKIITHFFVLAILLISSSCDRSSQKNSATTTSDTTDLKEGSLTIDTSDVLENTVLSQDQQTSLKPEKVLSILREGNEDFMNDRLTIRNNSARVRAAALNQYPKAVILSCLDSRVPVEDVFHRGIGDVFVARIAGNIVNEDLLGSMEFGCKVSGAKLILVLGHEHCGAIKSAIDNVKLGNITPLLAKIRPAVTMAKYDGDKSSKDNGFVHVVCEENVRLTIENIRKNSTILAEMEKNKELIIKGAVYNMDSGKVTFL